MQFTTAPKDESPIHVSISRFSKGIGTVFAGVIEILQSLEPQAAHDLISTYLPKEETEHEHEAAPTAHDASGIGDNRNDNGAVPDSGAEDVKKAQGTADPASAAAPAASSVPPSSSIPAGTKVPAPSVTPDDITKVIVAKLKQNRSNNTAIGAILRSYQVDKVSDLQPEQYEAFLTDLSRL